MLLRYPAIVEGSPPNRKRHRSCVVVREVELDISELDPDEAPVAATLRSATEMFGNQVVAECEVRTFSGRFFLRQQFPRDLERLLGDPWHERDFKRRLVSRMLRGVERTRPEDIWPDGLVTRDQRLSKDDDIRTACLKGSPQVALTRNGQAQAAASDAFAVRECSFVLIAGQPWREIAEPVFAARVGTNAKLTIATEDLWTSIPLAAVSTSFFPLTDRAAALAEIASFKPREIDFSESDAEILMPEVFSPDFDALNFARFSRAVVTEASGLVSRDDPMQDLIAEVGTMTSGRVVDIDFTRLDEAMNLIVDSVGSLSTDSLSSKWAAAVPLIRARMERWNQRPVELSLSAPRAPDFREPTWPVRR